AKYTYGTLVPAQSNFHIDLLIRRAQQRHDRISAKEEQVGKLIVEIVKNFPGGRITFSREGSNRSRDSSGKAASNWFSRTSLRSCMSERASQAAARSSRQTRQPFKACKAYRASSKACCSSIVSAGSLNRSLARATMTFSASVIRSATLLRLVSNSAAL